MSEAASGAANGSPREVTENELKALLKSQKSVQA
jgi:hypothetical protein